jgi:hypothetical protein
MYFYLTINTALLAIGFIFWASTLVGYKGKSTCVREAREYENLFCSQVEDLKMRAIKSGYFDTNAKKIVDSGGEMEQEIDKMLERCRNEKEKRSVLRSFERMIEYKNSAMLDINAILHDKEMNRFNRQF